MKALLLSDKSVNSEEFIKFLKRCREIKKEGKLYLFVDNMTVHRSKIVTEYCQKAKIELLFNSAYSSEVNPIERLWAISKREFSKSLIDRV